MINSKTLGLASEKAWRAGGCGIGCSAGTFNSMKQRFTAVRLRAEGVVLSVSRAPKTTQPGRPAS